jgi:ABC-type uncharacterized transport system YnjBCD ATPase subunit
MNELKKKIIQQIKESLNLPNAEENERLRIELYKTLEAIAHNLTIDDRAMRLDLSPLNEHLRQYGYSLAYRSMEIPIIMQTPKSEIFRNER